MVIRYHKTLRPSSLNDGIGQGLQDCPVLSIYSSPDGLGEVAKFNVRILPNRPARGFHNRDYPRISLERGGIRTHPRHSLPRIKSQARFRQPSRSSLHKGRYWECLFSLCRRGYPFLPRPLLCAFIVSQLRRFVKRFLKISFEKVAGRMRRYTAALSLISPREATRIRASTVRPLSESFFPSGSLLLTPI